MIISKVNHSVSFKGQNKPVSKKKAAIAVGGAAVSVAGLYLAGKHHLLGDRIFEFLNKTPVNSDKLSYQIQAPKYDTSIVLAEEESGYRIYQSILDNINQDKNTAKRLDEVSATMTEDFSAVLGKIAEIRGDEKITLSPESRLFDLDIAKKRYYSLPDKKQLGYSGLDPLTHQKPREEIVDLNLGYRVLEELNTNSSSELLDLLSETYSSKISDKDKSFISQCASKLAPEGAKCYGKSSVLHSRDLSAVGKIFREAMGLTVR